MSFAPRGSTLAVRVAARTFATSCGCVLWLGAVNREGYGKILYRGQNQLVHRVVFEEAEGRRRASSEYVCHACDNPACINLAHLFLGSSGDNQRDSVMKGRRKNSRAFGWDEALMVRAKLAAGATCRGLARELGVSDTTIRNIKNGRAWNK